MTDTSNQSITLDADVAHALLASAEDAEVRWSDFWNQEDLSEYSDEDIADALRRDKSNKRALTVLRGLLEARPAPDLSGANVRVVRTRYVTEETRLAGHIDPSLLPEDCRTSGVEHFVDVNDVDNPRGLAAALEALTPTSTPTYGDCDEPDERYEIVLL